MKIRPLEENDVRIEVLAVQETDDPDLHLHFDNKDVINEIRRRIEAGDVWGWCEVTVRASIGSVYGESCLCACSYESEEDFRQDAYFEDLKKEALAELNRKVQEFLEILEPFRVLGSVGNP